MSDKEIEQRDQQIETLRSVKRKQDALIAELRADVAQAQAIRQIREHLIAKLVQKAMLEAIVKSVDAIDLTAVIAEADQ